MVEDPRRPTITAPKLGGSLFERKPEAAKYPGDAVRTLRALRLRVFWVLLIHQEHSASHLSGDEEKPDEKA